MEINDKDEETVKDFNSSANENDTVSKSKKKNKKKSNKNKLSHNQFQFSTLRSKIVSTAESVYKGRLLKSVSDIPAGCLFWTEKSVCSVSHNGNSLCYTCGACIDANSGFRCEFMPLEVFCGSTCKDIAEKDLEFYKVISAIIPTVAASRSCDQDLLKMVFKLIAWEHRVLSSSATDTSFLIDLSDASSGGDDGTESVIQSTIQGLTALEAHIDHQTPEWIASVQSAIEDVIRSLPSDMVLEFSSVVTESSSESIQNLSPRCTSTNGLDTSPDPTASLVRHALLLASKVNVNAYGILDTSSTESQSKTLGFGMFPAVGLCVNHDCYPNSTFTFNSKGCIEFRTLRAVCAGEELTVSYVDLFQNTAMRRKLIQEKRFFNCQCGRCIGYDMICDYLNQSTITAEAKSVVVEGKTSKAKSKNKQNNQSTIGEVSQLTCDEYFTMQLQHLKKEGIVFSYEIPQLAVSDAMLSGLYCEQCGPAGVLVSVPTVNPSTTTALTIKCDSNAVSAQIAQCLFCNRQADPQEVQQSNEYATTTWNVCKNTVSYMAKSRATLTHIEKWLNEMDPSFSQTVLHPSASTQMIAGGGANRKRKCPLQLHVNHGLIVDAYLLYIKHILCTARGLAGTTASECYKGAISALRRVLAVMQTVLPVNHPELSYLTLELVSAIDLELGTKGSTGATSKATQDLRKERKDLVTKAIQSRIVAYGKEHPLTMVAERMLVI